MPLINGMKMACEPCIRGHRSTKCTHANERLMVPVRKPGRPLSSCPHPHSQPCGCGTVTAAIPRKQACHCGTSTPPISSGQATPQDIQNNADVPSPTKTSFKVQKTTSRPPSSRKQSFDPANFERMDMNSVNIVPFEQRPSGIPLPFANPYALPGAPQAYGYVPQYASLQAQLGHVSMQSIPHIPSRSPDGPNGFNKENVLEHVIESPLTTPTELTSNGSNGEVKPGSCCAPSRSVSESSGKTNDATNGASCCGPKRASHSHSSSSASSILEPPEIKAHGCCSSKSSLVKQEPVLSHGTPMMAPQMLPPNGMLNHPIYPHYMPQNTVFTYPPTYGSFQNPLQPSAWRQSVLANSYGQIPAPLPPGGLPFNPPVISENADTVHTCGCGDGCQCIGCAAHPYNDATQDYVRSAWSSMNAEQGHSEIHMNGASNGNGHPTPTGPETINSPIANTPSSTTSANGEEQNFSASDFFFVSYPFSSEEGCGGETESCPCGDDCQCFGCTIHQQPPIPCEGEKEICPCGDDCECIGCEIHNGTVKV